MLNLLLRRGALVLVLACGVAGAAAETSLTDAVKRGDRAAITTLLRQRADKEFGVTVYEPDLTPWRRMSPAIIQALEADGTIPTGLPGRVSQMSGF